MKGLWWKVPSVLLLLFVVVFGLRTPLRPGLVHVSTDRLAPGPVTFAVEGYGTHFMADSTWFWLENSGQQFCADRVEVRSATQALVSITVPAEVRDRLSTLRGHSSRDGGMALHEAFYHEAIGAGVENASPCTVAEASMAAGALFPNRSILNETIRNLFFHVPMWFAMMVLMAIAFVRGIQVLRSGDLEHDRMATTAVDVSLLFATLGLVSGSLWARVTWGGWWTSDPKLNGSAVTMLIYTAYVVLRGAVPDPHKRARLAAVYNIFAFVLMLVFVMVLPRLTDSLHPGNGGNPAFSQYDLDDNLRRVFYPAVIGWIGLALWANSLTYRLARAQAAAHEANDR